jgi:hypothetical protein
VQIDELALGVAQRLQFFEADVAAMFRRVVDARRSRGCGDRGDERSHGEPGDAPPFQFRLCSSSSVLAHDARVYDREPDVSAYAVAARSIRSLMTFI